MKFDVVLGNPPYQNGNDKNFYKKFINKAKEISDRVAFIVPSAYFRSKQATNELATYQFLGNPFKGVKLTMVFFEYKKGSISTKFIGTDDIVNLDNKNIKFVPGFTVREWSNQISLVANKNNGLLIKAGKLKRREAEEFVGNDITCILSTGPRHKEFDTCMLDKKHISLVGGLGCHKVIFGADYNLGDIGPIKYAGKDLGCSARAMYIECNSKHEALDLIKYLESKNLKEFIKHIKTLTAKNSKTLFNSITDPRVKC